MSSFFDDLEAQLRSAARARTGARRDVPRQRRSRHGWLRTGIGAVPMVAAVLVPLVVVGAALVLLTHRGHGTAPPTPPSGGGINAILAHTPKAQIRRELGYVFAATGSVQNSKACRLKQRARVTYLQGSPGSDLLSILGVLRRPATPADRLNPGAMQRTPNVYRAYIRRAFSAGGLSYYIVPSRVDRAATAPSDRCLQAQNAAFKRELPRIPASLREPTRQLLAAWIAYERSLAQSPRDTICLFFANSNESGGGCRLSAKAIEEGLATESSPTAYSGVVPDGVATVTVIFPASRGQAPASVTAPVKGNVYAAPLRNPLDSNLSPTVIWRSAQGRVLKRFSNPGAKVLAAMCKQNPIVCLLVRGVSTSTSSTSSASGRRARG